jgi:DMSO/TMAO reductase YedYZ molybdopterin-dependent catalytic subunit
MAVEEPSRRSVRSLAIGAGLAGAAVATAALAVAHSLARSVPFLTVSIAQTLVRTAPGGFATHAIELLGHAALPLAVAATAAGFFAAAGLLGLLIPRLGPGVRGGPVVGGILAFLPLWGASVLMYPEDPQFLDRAAMAVLTLVILVGAGAFAGWVFARASTTDRVEADADPGRRLILRALWWGAAATLLGVANLARILRPRPDPGLQALRLRNVAPAPVPSTGPANRVFDAIPGLTTEVTSNTDFYVVDEEIVDPDIDPQTWRLTVGGLVDREVRFTYEELRSMPAVERYQTLECISNEVGGDLISTARWVGIPVPVLLDRAGVDPAAVEVVFRAAGGYADSLTIDQAMDPSTLVAIGMNGQVLPRAHGFPARLLSVGTFGMKNPKWLVRMDVVDRPYQGFWEERGWSKAATVRTWSRIDVPHGGRSVPADAAVTVAGVAFAGDRGVDRVQVSTDGGRTWGDAELKRPLSPITWRLWRYRWRSVPEGPNEVLVRAIDGQGAVQTQAVAPPHPSGATGYDSISVAGG